MSKENIFNISSIHQQYWKEFCDVCYSRFGFEDGEVRTYEQKYHTFCRCKGYITEDSDYELELLRVHESDLQRLKKLSDWFFAIDDGKDVLPALYNFVRMMRTVGRNLKDDAFLVKYICPRKPKVNYASYRLDATKRVKEDIPNNSTLREIVKYKVDAAILEEILGTEEYYNTVEDRIFADDVYGETIEWNPADGTIIPVVNQIIEEKISYFNYKLDDFIDALPSGTECPRGSELQAFLYRLFMSFEDSLSEVKEELEELPSPINLEELKEESKRLIKEFYSTPLGQRWAKCIVCEGGLKHFAYYFMHHRKDFTEEDEHRFFYTLDKICLIEDVLNGNADKYWLDVKYPEGWFDKDIKKEIDDVRGMRNHLSKETEKKKVNVKFIGDSCTPYPFVSIPSLTDAIVTKILSYLQGKSPSQAKDVMKPIRAAQDAGVIRRITFEEMKTAFPEYCPKSKSSVSRYTKEDETPYTEQAFEDMVEDFQKLKNNRATNACILDY